MNGQKTNHEDADRLEWVKLALFHDMAGPVDQFPHADRGFRWRGRLEHHAKALALRAEGFDMVRRGLLMPAMMFVLG